MNYKYHLLSDQYKNVHGVMGAASNFQTPTGYAPVYYPVATSWLHVVIQSTLARLT
jgi:hypothetical protein